jgi:hypothetical protein
MIYKNQNFCAIKVHVIYWCGDGEIINGKFSFGQLRHS